MLQRVTRVCKAHGISKIKAQKARERRSSRDDDAATAKSTSWLVCSHFYLKLLLVVLAITCWTCIVSLLSFRIGRDSAVEAIRGDVKLGIIAKSFTYNRTFGEGRDESTIAWTAMFPPNGTFFTHPTLAPELSTISVYYQLHCIDGIRQAFWHVYGAAHANELFSDGSLPEMSSLPHVRHCLDLLRQTLMCHSDTTVEVRNVQFGGVTGFGTVRRCRDWDDLVRQTEEWQSQYPHVSQEQS